MYLGRNTWKVIRWRLNGGTVSRQGWWTSCVRGGFTDNCTGHEDIVRDMYIWQEASLFSV